MAAAQGSQSSPTGVKIASSGIASIVTYGPPPSKNCGADLGGSGGIAGLNAAQVSQVCPNSSRRRAPTPLVHATIPRFVNERDGSQSPVPISMSEGCSLDARPSRLLYTSGKMNLTRRSLLGLRGSPLAMAPRCPPSNSARPIQCAIAELEPVPTPSITAPPSGPRGHFSEIRFIGSLEPENCVQPPLRRRTRHRNRIGMKSICPLRKC